MADICDRRMAEAAKIRFPKFVPRLSFLPLLLFRQECGPSEVQASLPPPFPALRRFLEIIPEVRNDFPESPDETENSKLAEDFRARKRLPESSNLDAKTPRPRGGAQRIEEMSG
jgi:hypothetical protein